MSVMSVMMCQFSPHKMTQDVHFLKEGVGRGFSLTTPLPSVNLGATILQLC